MQTVIYADVLVAINFIINLMVLGLTRKLTGVPVRRYRRYLGALAGALASFVIFAPLQGIAFEVLVRVATTALVICITYWGQRLRTMLRLAAVFFTVGFIMAGFIMGVWFIVPHHLLAFRNGVFYFNITPLMLLCCAAVAYLFVSLFDSIFDAGSSKQGVWTATIYREGRHVELPLFMDTGNQLVEPFSGLPVVVVGLRAVSPLLSSGEYRYVLHRTGEAPTGMRHVFYSGVGSDGMLCAFRPQSIRLVRGESITECEGYVAVTLQELDSHGCGGIFNPRLLGVGVSV